MIPNLYLGNGCFTKHPFKTGCLEYQEVLKIKDFAFQLQNEESSSSESSVRLTIQQDKD